MSRNVFFDRQIQEMSLSVLYHACTGGLFKVQDVSFSLIVKFVIKGAIAQKHREHKT